MKAPAYKNIIKHSDRDEIVSKLIIGISPFDINAWLKGKYVNPNEKKFIISEKSLKSFKDDYLDFYTTLKEDFGKTKEALATNSQADLDLVIKGNSSYKNKMIELASKEIDIKDMIKTLCVNVETRCAQVFDAIQEDPANINTRVDRLLIEYMNTLAIVLEKYYKIVEKGPDQIVQHNVTLHAVDQHISVFHDVIKEVLTKMDLQTSMYFMEVFNEKMSKLKMPTESKMTTEQRFAEVEVLSETINKKLNE